MNNLLKIFLIINLVSSTASSVNNYSQPLSEENLAVGQNSSEIVKRGGKITVHGGTDVIGYTLSGRKTCQRPCTLSFPVSLNDDKHGITYKGHLTSFVCTTSGITVDDDLVGHVLTSYNFKPELGLDYAFVSIYPEYRSDTTTSQSVSYKQCASTGRGIVDVDKFIPILPIPSEPPYPGFKVCAYGGKSGLACGEIVESGVTIVVHAPGSCEKETAQFHDVTKVWMNKPYSYGDLGAPVYITLLIPDSTQIVADPVGQVVENVEGPIEENIWYYVPLDRILRDSGLSLLANLPTSTSAVTSDNNTSFSDNSEIEQNTSKVAIVPRQPNQPRALYGVAGNPIWVSSDGQQFTGNSKRCTLGFAIRNHGTRQFITHGFLTLGNCVHNRRVDSNGVFSYHASQQDPGQIEAVRIGIVAPLDFTQGRFGLNYAFVRLRPNSDQEIFWDDDTSTLIPIRGGFANVVNNYFVPSRNDRVCYYGGYSGHVCGWVVNPSTPLVRFSPWTREVSFRGFNFRLPLEFFLDLIKVRPDVIPIAMTDRVEHDSGAPVYSPIIGDNRQITAARPVGILLGYNAEYEDTGTRCELVRYMYCVSLARIFLDNNPDLRLIGTPHH